MVLEARPAATPEQTGLRPGTKQAVAHRRAVACLVCRIPFRAGRHRLRGSAQDASAGMVCAQTIWRSSSTARHKASILLANEDRSSATGTGASERARSSS